ncbi:MAG: tRNA (N6-isopentenyl adenosine(37)-C2)-methylthiotransferase MiaB [Pseudomonadota bacterium]
MYKVHIRTYGCQMNARDSEQVSQMFLDRGGYEMTVAEEEADVILINTCSVRDQAEQKALGKMGMMGKLRKVKPHVVYGFLGCMAQSRGAELIQDIKHLDLVAGTQKYHRVVDYVDTILRKRIEKQMDDLRFTIVDVDEEKASQNTIRDHKLKAQQATAFVSIMQGCNMKCSFCIVPYTRGAERGRPINDIVTEIRGLAGRGVREVTLLGQIVNLYGRREFPRVDRKSPFVQLLEAVHDIEGIERIRFTSPHPIGYQDDLINAFRYLPKLASHVHFPMQSGSDRILRQMRRPYKTEKFVRICEKMKEARPDLAFTTDIIVGFPGETDEDYEATKDVVRRIEFDNAFIFRYSKRRDTPAAEMPDELQLPESVKEERNQDLLALVNQIARAKNNGLIGQEVEVLCEGTSKNNPNTLMGRTSQNKIVIFAGNADRLSGRLLNVSINESTGFTLYGDLTNIDDIGLDVSHADQSTPATIEVNTHIPLRGPKRGQAEMG